MDFEPFLAYWKTSRKCSEQTIRAYRNDMKLFGAFMQQRGLRRVNQFGFAELNDYIHHMQHKANPRFERSGLEESSIQRRLASLSSYFDYLRATGSPKLRNPIREFKRRSHRNNSPKPVDELMLDQLLGGITNLRDRLIVTLFLATGLRVSELYSLNRDTIKFLAEIDETGQEKLSGHGVVLGKGNKVRTFFVDPVTLELYAGYLQGRADDASALFLSQRKQRMSVRAIQDRVATWCKKLGLSHVRVHQLRHSFATRLANAHISSMALKTLMGHSSLTTTCNYFKLHDTTLSQSYFSAMEFLNEMTPPSSSGMQAE